ncbi:MAG: methylated-DNA--[protein]-cysteine S-methyltransferase [Verrucomicrobiales bacterium]|nr:methylated-DNA--[protein]-cysteine S-methyltransferase [Verrucomicrobiales bacterium]
MKTTTNILGEHEMRSAWSRRDDAYDGLFVFGVTTTRIYCRPSCPSRPQERHLVFFQCNTDAQRAGYRACRRCTPDARPGEPPDWIQRLIQRLPTRDSRKITSADLQSWGFAPERVRRWFQRQHGMSFAAWWRNRRLLQAKSALRQGSSVDDAVFEQGFESHSGFRAAFERAFGSPPGRSRTQECLCVTLIPTPLGSMLAAAHESGLCHLEFSSPSRLTTDRERIHRRFRLPVIPGENSVLIRLARELESYFATGRPEFTVPIHARGTKFQQKVWDALRTIPPGTTWSYARLADRIGAPSAVRAVARANATNPVQILIPCHRVIGKDGRLSGYAGGVWRKQRLLQLECGQSRTVQPRN